MANLNKVLMMGNLTKDPELRYTPSGMAVATLRIATNRRFRVKSGEQKEETCFINAVVWDKQAEACNQYLRKGSSVFVEGRLQSRSWDAPDGAKRSVIEIRAERVQFLSSAKQTGGPVDAADSPSDEIKEPVDDASGESSGGSSWPSEENN